MFSACATRFAPRLVPLVCLVVLSYIRLNLRGDTKSEIMAVKAVAKTSVWKWLYRFVMFLGALQVGCVAINYGAGDASGLELIGAMGLWASIWLCKPMWVPPLDAR